MSPTRVLQHSQVCLAELPASYLDGADRRPPVAADDANHVGLPGSVGPHQRPTLSPSNLSAHIDQRGFALVFQSDFSKGDDGTGRGYSLVLVA